MNQLRFSFSLRYGHPQECMAIKKLAEIPASRRATLLRSMIADSITKMPAAFSWTEARESAHAPERYSLYLDPLVEFDGPAIDAIQRIPVTFVGDWIRERLCAAVAPSDAPAQQTAPAVHPSPTQKVAAPTPTTTTPSIEPIPTAAIHQSMRPEFGSLFS